MTYNYSRYSYCDVHKDCSLASLVFESTTAYLALNLPQLHCNKRGSTFTSNSERLLQEPTNFHCKRHLSMRRPLNSVKRSFSRRCAAALSTYQDVLSMALNSTGLHSPSTANGGFSWRSTRCKQHSHCIQGVFTTANRVIQVSMESIMGNRWPEGLSLLTSVRPMAHDRKASKRVEKIPMIN
eukprot:Gb_29870 [translate_table: standard]